ncbi:hypothetical protein M0805_002637 [Coniferiporia weirii]|nr:hypothetical protein M0805_002637 [Coniferiporia weirii]
MAQTLPHAIMYPAGQQVHYLPQYYSAPYAQFAPSPYPERTIKPERRRPKYTRSKTGCLTCRRKKVKCDETKTTCQRCANSQLECTWPEAPPPKKKNPLRKRGSPADHDSNAASDAGTSSLSPAAMGYSEGTPQPPFVSEPASPDGTQGSHAPQLNYPDPNMLHVGASASNDRRHSEPDLQAHSEASGMDSRRHSVTDLIDHQRYGHPSVGGGSALGLTLNQHQHHAGTRPSTPSDFLYPHNAHTQAHTHSHPHVSAPGGYAGYSPVGSMSILPNLSGASTSSRPSTASSLSLSHSFARRTSAGTGSRPSTAGSLGMSTSASMGGRPYAHRPASSCGGSGSAHSNGSASGSGVCITPGDSMGLGLSPFSFQMHNGARNGGDVGMDTSAFGGYAPVSRPSTANSATSSPFLRHVTGGDAMTGGPGSVNMNGNGGAERWQPSPLLGHHSPLAAPHAHSATSDGYFPHLIHSPAPQSLALSRAHSPSPAWNY